MFKFVVLAIAVSAVHCQYGGHQASYHQPAEYKGESHEDYYTEPHYSFEYSVNDPHTGDIKSQKEQREGESTHGEYSLVEPDGSVRAIKYSVEGKSGFLAEVQKEAGKYNSAPEPSYYKPQPSYNKPQPSYYKPAPQPSYYKPAPQPSYYKPAPQPSYYKPSY